MAAVPKITKTAVDNMEVSKSGPTFLWDSALPGFGVKCTPKGVKRYVVKYRTDGGGRSAKQRWLTLGGHGQLTPSQAREMAQQALADVARGKDPQGAKSNRREAATLGDVWERFKTDHLLSRKPQTRGEYESQWRNILRPAFGRTLVAQINRDDIDRLHKRLRSTPYRANRIVALLSRLFSLAELWGHRPAGSNPCRHIERFQEKPRTRFLSLVELEALGRAIDNMMDEKTLQPAAANAIRLLLLTGARLNEVLSAETAWIDLSRRVIALPDSKTGEKLLFLSDAAIDVLKEQMSLSGGDKFLFPGPGKDGWMVNLRKPWAKICDRAGLVGVRLHDLRHTAASVAVGQGASLPIIGRLLGHTQPQTTQRYAHVDVDPALIAANAIGQIIGAALRSGTAQIDREAPEDSGK